MYFLNTQIAEQIIKRTTHIIKHKINVMNNKGIILASGDPHRIGLAHEGAQLAINQNRVVEIPINHKNTFQGVQAGINLPLHFKGHIIGVIGITGSPEPLRQFGELLKMTAEMIVEQAESLRQAQWDHRQKEELTLQLIKQNQGDPRIQQQWAEQLGIDLHLPRVACVIQLITPLEPDTKQDELNTLVQLLDSPKRGNLVAITSLTELVILKPTAVGTKGWSTERESQRIDSLLKRLPIHLKSRVKIALGQYFPNPQDLHLSYKTAKETLLIGIKTNPTSHKYVFEHYTLQVLLSDLKHHWQGKELLRPYEKLVQYDKNQKLIKTLYVYLSHFGDQQACANALFIHRNTLRYRLEKIEEITGISVKSLEGVCLLYISQLLSK
nr:sugar diacid recognition domain-containing protein [uncultured Shewanella sp.]